MSITVVPTIQWFQNISVSSGNMAFTDLLIAGLSQNRTHNSRGIVCESLNTDALVLGTDIYRK